MEETRIVEVEDLARWLKITPQTIRKYRAGASSCALLDDLPEPVMTRPRLVWWKEDIEAWISSRRKYKPKEADASNQATEQPQKKRGRPRKVTYQPSAGV